MDTEKFCRMSDQPLNVGAVIFNEREELLLLELNSIFSLPSCYSEKDSGDVELMRKDFDERFHHSRISLDNILVTDGFYGVFNGKRVYLFILEGKLPEISTRGERTLFFERYDLLKKMRSLSETDSKILYSLPKGSI